MNWSLVPVPSAPAMWGHANGWATTARNMKGMRSQNFMSPEEAPDISEKQVDSQPAPGQGAGAAASWDAGRF